MARKTKHPTYRIQKREGRADLAFAVISGKRVYLGDWNTDESREQYARLIAEWKAAQSSPVRTLNVHVMTLIKQYWQFAQGYYGKSSPHTSHCKSVLRIVKALYGRTLVDDFGPKALKACRGEMIEEGWSRKYVNAQVFRVRAMFRWGIEEELVHPDTLLRLEAVRGLRRGKTTAPEPKKIATVPQEHIDPVKCLVASQVAALIDLQLATGARAGELVGLRACDIDMSGDVWLVKLAEHKTAHYGRDRLIPLYADGQAVVRPWLMRRLDAPLFSPREAAAELKRRNATEGKPRREDQKPNPKKTDRAIGDQYTTTTYRRAIERACKTAGIPKWTPHRLRHTAGTRFRKLYGLDTARAILGHSVAAMTEHYSLEHDRELIITAGRKAG